MRRRAARRWAARRWGRSRRWRAGGGRGRVGVVPRPWFAKFGMEDGEAIVKVGGGEEKRDGEMEWIM